MQCIHRKSLPGLRSAGLWLLLVANLVPVIGRAASPNTANEQVIQHLIGAMDHMMATHDMALLSGIMNKYWTEDCVQHHGEVTLQRPELIKSIASLIPAPKSSTPARPQAPFKTVLLTSFNDRVILVRRRVVPGQNPDKSAETYVFNVYRLQNGKVAENWWGLSLP